MFKCCICGRFDDSEACVDSYGLIYCWSCCDALLSALGYNYYAV